MTPERTNWMIQRQELSLTPMEVVDRLNAATRKLCADPDNHVAKKYFADIGPASQDIFIGELAIAVFNNPPPP